MIDSRMILNAKLTKSLIIFTAGIVVGFLVRTALPTNSVSESQLNVCINALRVSGELTNNYSAAYSFTRQCVTNQDSCNWQEVTNQLLRLNQEKQELELEILNLTQQIRQISPD